MSKTTPDTKARGRLKRPASLLVFVVLFVLSTGYLLLAGIDGHRSGVIEAIYHAVILACYAALWMLLSDLFAHQRATPPQAFWHAFIVGAACMVLAEVTLALPGGLSAEGQPVAITSIIQNSALGLLAAVFSFVLLLCFRDLLLYRRTKNSQRNWRLMLGFMVLAALLALLSEAFPENEFSMIPAVLCLVPAIALMVVNSFRVSWIVRLSSKEKATSILLAMLVMLLFGVAIATPSLRISEISPGLPNLALFEHVAHYSLSLSIFSYFGIIFGFLYCLTSILSLLFHLPTTSDFQRRADEMAAMQSLTALVKEVFDLEKLLSTITASPVEAGTGSSSWLAVPDPESGSLQPRVIATHKISEHAVTTLVNTDALYRDMVGANDSILLEQATADYRVLASPADGILSLLVIPLSARKKILGALFVASDVTHGFEKDDIEAISVFAAQAAQALENAQLFEEQIEHERLARELAIAREVQQKLLPQHLPESDSLTVAASSVSAYEVGGDYYDYVELDDRRLAFIVGDVSGKGTSAAFYMAEMQGVFRSVARLAPAPRDFLSHANRALGMSLEKNVFISAIYGLIDSEREEMTIARAGHCPAAAVGITGEARYLRSRGLGLGLDRTDLFYETLEVERLALRPGDVVVLYTDGVVESRNADGEEYGYKRFLQSLRQHRHEDAPALHDALLEDLDLFLGGLHRYNDDMTLVVLKWLGLSSAQKMNGGPAGKAKGTVP